MKKVILLALSVTLSFGADAYTKTIPSPATTFSFEDDPNAKNAQTQNNKKAAAPYADMLGKNNQTAGSYVGLDVARTETCFMVHDTTYGTPNSYPPSNCGATASVGANYKYAFNYNGLFIAPGAFFEYYLSNPVKGLDGVNLENKNRYGLKADLGYDLTSKFSPYVTGGYARVDYRARSRGEDIAQNNLTIGKNGGDNSFFWGAGLKYDFTPNLSANLEYQLQNYKARAAVPSDSSDYLSNVYFAVRLNIYRAGISYHF